MKVLQQTTSPATLKAIKAGLTMKMAPRLKADLARFNPPGQPEAAVIFEKFDEMYEDARSAGVVVAIDKDVPRAMQERLTLTANGIDKISAIDLPVSPLVLVVHTAGDVEDILVFERQQERGIFGFTTLWTDERLWLRHELPLCVFWRGISNHERVATVHPAYYGPGTGTTQERASERTGSYIGSQLSLLAAYMYFNGPDPLEPASGPGLSALQAQALAQGVKVVDCRLCGIPAHMLERARGSRRPRPVL